MRRHIRSRDMPEEGRIGKMVLFLFFKEAHANDPHIHVRYEGKRTRIEIDTGDVMGRTNLTVRQLRLVREWIEDNEDRLLDKWDRLREDEVRRRQKRR